MPTFKDEVRASNYSTNNPDPNFVHEINCIICGAVHNVPPGEFADCKCGTKLSRISEHTLLVEGTVRKKNDENKARAHTGNKK